MATYMCGCLRDHITPEEIRQQAFQAGREKQGKLNAETVREIHDHVYVEAYNKALADYHSAVEYNIMVAGRMDLLVNDEIAVNLLKKDEK